MPNDSEKQVVIRISNELYDEVKTRSAQDERSIAQTVRYALRQYLATPP